MGVRYQGTFIPYSDKASEELVIQIVDLEGGGATPIRIVDFHTFSEGESLEPTTILNPQRAEMTFLIEDTAMEAFIEDVATTVIDRFYLVASSGLYEIFVGVFDIDQVEWADISYPFPFTVVAIDGIGRLRDIDYLDENGDPYVDDTVDNYFSWHDHFFNCLSKLNLDQIYDQKYSPKRVWFNSNWYAANMADTSDNPLKYVMIPASVFYTKDNEDNLLPMTCYEVVEQLLKAFFLKLDYGGGIYRIEQLSNRGNLLNHYFTYQLDGTDAGDRNQSWRRFIEKDETALALPLAGGTFSMLAALRQVKVSYTYDIFQVASEPVGKMGFGGTGEGQVCYLYDYGNMSLRPIIDIKRDRDLDYVFRVTMQIMLRTSGYAEATLDNWVDHKYVFRVSLAVGSRSARPDYYIYVSTVSGYDDEVREEPIWAPESLLGNETSLSAKGWEWFSPEVTYRGQNPAPSYYDVGFETIPFKDLPIDASDVNDYQGYICVELVRIETAGEDDGPPLPLANVYEWSFSDLTVIVAEESTTAKPTKKTQEFTSVINEGGKGEKEIEILFGTNGGTLLIDTGGGFAAPDPGFGVGPGGGDLELGQLLANEYHSVRGVPKKLMDRSIMGRENNAIYNLVQYDYCGKNWLAIRTDHDYYKQEVTGLWWELDDAPSLPVGSTQTIKEIGREYNRIDSPDDGKGKGKRLLDKGRDGNGFSAPTTKFLVTEFTLPDKDLYPGEYMVDYMNKTLDVYINGNKLEYIYTIPLSQGNTWYTVDNTDNSIVVSDNFPLSARHWIQVYKNR